MLILKVLGQNTNFVKNPVSQPFTEQLVSDFNMTPLNYSYYFIKDYTASSLYINTESGDLKQAQEPEISTEFGLKTQGLYRNNKNILFFGGIDISKSYYKNLKWNLSFMLPKHGIMEDPHYFAVSKAANWNNQEYNIDGGFIIPIKNRFKVLFKTKYNLANKYRTDYDPRTEVTYNELNFTLGSNFKINDKYHVKVSAMYGYYNVDNKNIFSNINKNRPVNYDIYVKWFLGYGTLSSPFSTNIPSTKRITNKYSIELGYTYTHNKVTIMADFNLLYKNQLTYKTSGVIDKKDSNEYHADFKPTTINTKILSLYNIAPNKTLKLKLQGNFENGSNFWYSKGGKTYSRTQNNYLASVSYLNTKTNQDFWDLGIDFNYWDLDQKDALSTTKSSYSNFQVEQYILRLFPVSNKVSLAPYLKYNLRLNVDSNFYQGNIEALNNIAEYDFAAYTLRDFYNEVIYPDFELFTKNQLSLCLGNTLHFKQKNNVQLSLKLEGGYAIPLQNMLNFNKSKQYYGHASLIVSY
ncbi:MAG: DUF6850 family outer membrane beta-barrel protein [Aestuariibaculum sp.]